MIKLIILLALFGFLICLGVMEKIKNRKNLACLGIRINVNGIRGKSTVTRLITSILHEAGIVTIGKTTGTAPRIIIPAENIEEPIIRSPQGANIKEQIFTIQKAVSLEAEALVCECMAVRPDYQDVYQNQMFHANITVIVNVFEDHLDEMGPTLDEIAIAFSKSIPWNGALIVSKDKYTEYFSEIARRQNTKIIVADEELVPPGYLDRFDYLLFPNNVALSLAVAEALGIPQRRALKGMLKALPDPGALRINHLDGNNSFFINGFAANEPQSSLNIWNRIRSIDHLPTENPIVLFNGRPDRVDRTHQFIKDFFPLLEGVTLVGMGQCIQPIRKAMDEGLFPGVLEYTDMEDFTGEQVAEALRPLMSQRLLFGVGNIHGDAHELIEVLLSLRTLSQATDTVVADIPERDIPAANRPVRDIPVANRPVRDIPVAYRPATDIPAANRLVTDIPAAYRPVVDLPIADLPAAASLTYPSAAEKASHTPATEKIAFMNAKDRLSTVPAKKRLRNEPVAADRYEQLPEKVPAVSSSDRSISQKSNWAVITDNVVYTRFNKKKDVSNKQQRQSARY